MATKIALLATVISKESSEMILTRNFVTAKPFSAPSVVQMLSSYAVVSLIPTLIDDKSDAIVLHVGTNDILNHANHENVAHSIINIGLDCKNNGVNEVFISSILVKKNPNLTTIVPRVNDPLRDICEKNGFSFICDDVITTNYLWKDVPHLQNMVTHFLSNYFLKFLNYSIDSNFDNRL